MRQKLTIAGLTKQINKLCPISKSTKDQDRHASWVRLISKIQLSLTSNRKLIVITANPEILANKDILEETFGCAITSPTEARAGYDYIS